jgi:tRNA 2-thiouridine synthesizing protein A
LATEPTTIDARGLKCPLPVLKLEKWLADAPSGATVVVLATDPMARIDIPLHCRQKGHRHALEEADGVLRFTVTKSPEA